MHFSDKGMRGEGVSETATSVSFLMGENVVAYSRDSMPAPKSRRFSSSGCHISYGPERAWRNPTPSSIDS